MSAWFLDKHENKKKQKRGEEKKLERNHYAKSDWASSARRDGQKKNEIIPAG